MASSFSSAAEPTPPALPYKARIIGTGMYVPPRVVTNHDLARLFETSDEWIVQRSGIQTRRYVEDGVGASDLGLEASRMAIRNAGIRPEDLDLILFATLSPDITFPGSACLLQHKLGLKGCAALDLRNQCSGFLYGLVVAAQFIATGFYRNILLVGAEVHSTGLDFSNRGREVTVLFGDGAGAVVLTRAEDSTRGMLAATLHADGSEAEALWLVAPQSRRIPRITPEMLDEGLHYPKMNGKHVFKYAVEHLPAAIHTVLDQSGHELSEVKLLIPHQANLRINELVARKLGIDGDRVYHNIQRYGNTTAASIPIALHEALQEGKFSEGDLVLFAAFGSGFTWGAALFRW